MQCTLLYVVEYDVILSNHSIITATYIICKAFSFLISFPTSSCITRYGIILCIQFYYMTIRRLQIFSKFLFTVCKFHNKVLLWKYIAFGYFFQYFYVLYYSIKFFFHENTLPLNSFQSFASNFRRNSIVYKIGVRCLNNNMLYLRLNYALQHHSLPLPIKPVIYRVIFDSN